MAAAESSGRPAVEDRTRSLWSLMEARQRCLRARIAACEELTAEMAALQAALAAARPAPAPARRAPSPAGGSSAPGGGGAAAEP